MSHPTSLGALAALLTGADARATVTDRHDLEGHGHSERLAARIEAQGVAVAIEMQTAAAPGGPVSFHDLRVLPESTTRLAAWGLVADPLDTCVPVNERMQAQVELEGFAVGVLTAHADTIRGQLVRSGSTA